MTRTATIALTIEEQSLLDQVTFDYDEQEHQDVDANGAAVAGLMGALLDRRAIADHRWRVFTDPDFNPTGRGRSNQRIFEKNGSGGHAMFRHPHFLPYLAYFLRGPDLPERFQAEFSHAVDRMAPITSGDLAPLGKLARKLVRDHGLGAAEARDEVFRLALDCGLGAWQAASIRSQVTR